MRYSKETEQVEVLKVTLNKKQAENIKLAISDAINAYGSTNAEAKVFQSILDEWLEGGL